MARKRPKKQRPQVGQLGKYLTRRSRGRCELCASRAQPTPYELPPFPDEPELDRSLIVCRRCRNWLDYGSVLPKEARFLQEAVWSELPAVRLAAVRMLISCDRGEPWVIDALETVQVNTTGEYAELA